MGLVFDAEKDAANLRKHGISLADADRLDLSQAFVVADQRYEYGEARFQAYGRIDGRLHILAFTLRGEDVRAISFRKANKREERRNGKRHQT